MTTAAQLSIAQIVRLPAMPKVQDAFAALNIGSTSGYALIKAGEFPIEVIKLGGSYRVRKADLLEFLGLSHHVAAEVQSAVTTNDGAPGVQPGAPTEQPAPTSK